MQKPILWLLTLAALLNMGCATIFLQDDGFSDKMHQQCRDQNSCTRLELEARDRTRRCRANTVGYVRCQEAQADVGWLQDQVNNYEAQTKALEKKAAAARQREEAELRERQARIDAEEKARQEEEAARQAKIKAAAQELEDWNSAHVDECQRASSIDACNDLRRYALKYRNGSLHLAAAESSLAEATPKIEALRDDEAWKGSRVADCKRPKTSDACQGVTAYLQQFPSGKYSDEGRKVITGSERTIAALAAAEERKRIWEEKMAEQKRLAEERAEAARETARAAAEDDGTTEVYTTSGGGRSYRGGGGRSRGGGGSVHVREYTRRDGTHVRSHTRSRGRR